MAEWRQATAKPSVTKAWLAEKVAEEQRNKQLRNQLVSAFMDFTPVVGNIKAAQETATGRNVVEDRELDTTERAIQGASVAIPGVAGITKGAALTRLLKSLGTGLRTKVIDPENLPHSLKLVGNVVALPQKILDRTSDIRFDPFMHNSGSVSYHTRMPIPLKENLNSGVLPETLFSPVPMNLPDPARTLVGHEATHLIQALPEENVIDKYRKMWQLRRDMKDLGRYQNEAIQYADDPTEIQAELLEHQIRVGVLDPKDLIAKVSDTSEHSAFAGAMKRAMENIRQRLFILEDTGVIPREDKVASIKNLEKYNW